MLARNLFSKTRTIRYIPSRFFSADPTKSELEAGKIEWGIKYDDECLKFEKEWEIIARKVQNEQ